MLEYIRLIKNSIKSHTLLTDILGYGLVLTGYADKYLARLITRYKIYNWLSKKYHIEKRKIENRENKIFLKDYVWICWLQGLENAPSIVKVCYESVLYWLKDKEIVLLTADNFSQYVNMPDYIIEKWKKGLISNAHFADLLRLELLICYGGLWIDATTFMTGQLPDYVEKSDFFVYRTGWMDQEILNMGNWFIYSKYKNNILLVETRRLLYQYWSKMNYAKEYFIFHMFFRMVTEIYSEEWSNVPMIHQMDQHLLMNELHKMYNEERCTNIMKLTPIHKLTYKIQFDDRDITARHLKYLYKIEKE